MSRAPEVQGQGSVSGRMKGQTTSSSVGTGKPTQAPRHPCTGCRSPTWQSAGHLLGPQPLVLPALAGQLALEGCGG